MKNKKGFTLVELVITIVVIVILSSISVPIYKTNIEKAALAEGYALLGTIRTHQENYYAEYGNFLLNISSSTNSYDVYTSFEEVLNINARTNKYFNTFSINYWNCGSGIAYNSANKQAYQFAAGVVGYVNGSNICLALRYNLTSGVDYYKGSVL
ncbi:MAG: prepilin-type N-terminal cleavage/methylation domain-containing protein [Elusimicrobia bacterium]|nr:prepilin-type N-terminal cleavage/methylation domain-containing protein [Elusimicrobiota bacterium]